MPFLEVVMPFLEVQLEKVHREEAVPFLWTSLLPACSMTLAQELSLVFLPPAAQGFPLPYLHLLHPAPAPPRQLLHHHQHVPHSGCEVSQPGLS